MELPYDWSGCEWLGVESYFAPSHEPPRYVTAGLEPMLEAMGVEVVKWN